MSTASQNGRPPLRIVAGKHVPEFKLGLTKGMQEKFEAIAKIIDQALDQAEEAHEAAEADSDSKLRADQLIRELEVALDTAEWMPPQDDPGAQVDLTHGSICR